MINDLTYFSNNNFYDALDQFFSDLKIPLKSHTAQPTLPSQILSNTYDESNEVHQLMDDIYFMGIVDDEAFSGEGSDKELSDIKADDQDYDGILIFGVELNKRENGRLPTRSHLSTITRLFNREFKYTPVNIVYKYSLDGNSYISFTSCERVPYKQEWREGEKVGKVSLLKDIDINNTHTGHLKILEELKVPASVNSFTGLYEHWQEIFDISTLNKKFYKEISDWYFWAKRNVTFPDDLPELEKEDERNAINLIRLLTRVLFVWFIKEKNLVNEELFNKEKLKTILINFNNPKNSGDTIYYKAILQNLFFATLNRELDKREDPDDAFRKKYDKNRDGNYGITNLFRYEDYFSIQQEEILELFNQSPFLNGGLFECLDRIKKEDDDFETKENNMVRVDGFSDRYDNRLNVPDFLFFGEERKVDLSSDYGKKSRKYKQAPVKGLIKILKSYKFTIAENTPIEQDIALDPELLGKVFENLLASYNPETKKTARKQTGSYYTPREIVNYMVDESLIGYLKNYLIQEKSGYIESGEKQTGLFGSKEKSKQMHFEDKIDTSKWKDNESELEDKLRILLSYNNLQPFNDSKTQNKIINALDNSKIIDPGCGSGAFPMGMLHKMVHILHKLDPKNEKWKNRQLKKAEQIEDIPTQEKTKKDIEEAFRKHELDFDYGRKLYLIENCIYGVDIQPIAVQISKLRFFISLVAEQEVNIEKDNYAIRPLPNLETKFVAANTLIGINKPDSMQRLFENSKIKDLENKLKNIRHKIFSAKTQKTKRKYREQDKQIRNKITKELTNIFENEINSIINNSQEKKEIEHFLNLIDQHGDKEKYRKEIKKRRQKLNKKREKYELKTHKTARQLAIWNPYDQNSSSSFFDPEWMFDISEFDIVIGNPPYKKTSDKKLRKIYEKSVFGRANKYRYFIHRSLDFLNKNGILCFINPRTILTDAYSKALRKYIINNYSIFKILNIVDRKNVFESVLQSCIINFFINNPNWQETKVSVINKPDDLIDIQYLKPGDDLYIFDSDGYPIWIVPEKKGVYEVFDKVKGYSKLNKFGFTFETGKIQWDKYKERLSAEPTNDKDIRLIWAEEIQRYSFNHPKKRIDKLYIRNHKNSEIGVIKHPTLVAQRTTAVEQEYRILINLVDPNVYDKNIQTENHTSYITSEINTTDLKTLLGVLSSRLMDFIFRHINSNTQVSCRELNSLPLPKRYKNYRIIAQLVDMITYKYSKTLDYIIELLVLQLYLPDTIESCNLNILNYLQNNNVLKNVGNDFDKLSDFKKDTIITYLLKHWRNPKYEVGKRLNNIHKNSPDYLSAILNK